MGQVFIPSPIATSPQALNQAQSASDIISTGSYSYDDLEGDYPNNPALAGNGYVNSSTPSTSYPDVEPGPIPQNPGYERLDAILKNVLTQDWKEKGQPGNPRILQCYEVTGHSYTRDGNAMDYAWCSAFVSWVLDTAGLPSKKTMGSQMWYDYGSEVAGWRGGDYSQLRKNDIVIFKSKERSGGHIGFLQEVLNDGKLKVLGGNQGNDAKVSVYYWDDATRGKPPNKGQYVRSVKRNWALPSEADVRIDGGTDTGGAGAGDDTTV